MDAFNLCRVSDLEFEGNTYQVVCCCASDKAYYPQVLALRKKVFVDEQQVSIELEVDDYENEAKHWLVLDPEGVPLAVARSREYQEGCQIRPVLKLERIAVALNQRGKNLGLFIMQQLLQYADAEGYDQVILASQEQVAGFYQKLGFEVEGEPFEDANMPHVWMRKWMI